MEQLGGCSPSLEAVRLPCGSMPKSQRKFATAFRPAMLVATPGQFNCPACIRVSGQHISDTCRAAAACAPVGTDPAPASQTEDGGWRTATERLLLMDSRDFNSVGIGLDDLIEAYMQTCLSMAAIDVLAGKLVSKKTGRFCYKLFEARARAARSSPMGCCKWHVCWRPSRRVRPQAPRGAHGWHARAARCSACGRAQCA